MELFKLNPGLAIWTWITFGVLFFILWKFALPTVLASIKKREELIAKSVDEAEAINKRMQDITREHDEIIIRANKEADEILSKTRKDAEVLKQRLLEKANKEAEEVMLKAREKIREERNAVILAIQNELAQFVCDSSEKIVGTSFTTEKDLELSRELVNSL